MIFLYIKDVSKDRIDAQKKSNEIMCQILKNRHIGIQHSDFHREIELAAHQLDIKKSINLT